MFLQFIKKNSINISVILGFIIIYASSCYFFVANYMGKEFWEVDPFTDASFLQFLFSTAYIAFFCFLTYYGKKSENILMLRFSIIQSAIMFIVPLLYLFFMIFKFETAFGGIIFSYILLVTMAPLMGFGIHPVAVLIIPVSGLILFILSFKFYKKVA